MSTKSQDTRQIADLAVIGLGPGGLAAALEAAKLGKKVVAFTDRDRYIRGQRMKLNPDVIEYFKSLVQFNEIDPFDFDPLNEVRLVPLDKDDEKFLEKIKADNNIVQIKDIERFLLRKLKSYSDLVTIVPVDRKGDSPDKKMSEVGKIEDGTSYIAVGERRYYCKNMLAADGAGHSFADFVSKGLEAEISYKESAAQERHLYQGVVQLRVKKGELPSRDKPSAIGQYWRHGWSETFSPFGTILSNADSSSVRKFNFAGEIPKIIFDMPTRNEAEKTAKKEALKHWASLFIRERYGYSSAQLEFHVSTLENLRKKIPN